MLAYVINIYMPLTSSPPIALASIQSEFSASSLSGAGLAYFGRANCNMLEFLGASAIVYNFGNYSAQAEAVAPYGNNATAQVYFLGDGRVIEYSAGESQAGFSSYTNTLYWATGTGINGGVEGYVVQDSNQGANGPTLNTWLSIDNIGFSASATTNSSSYSNAGDWTITWRKTSNQAALGTSYVSVSASFNQMPGSFSYNYGGSDIRLKRDIVLLETRADGIKVYSFRYKTSEEYYIGVMAQDLLGTQWESAVGTGSDGMYWVDYSKLPVKFELLKK